MKPTKKVLIISYYWPPCGGIAVLRCLKIAKYLRDFGWEPVIFTADNAHYPSIDHSNDRDIPEGATVLRQRIWEPYHIYKFLTGQKSDANVNNVFYVKDKKLGPFHNLSVWVRSNFFIPDARALWIRPSVRFLTQYLKENPVDAIFSDGPPHSNTRIATLLKQRTGIPWLADFQDPWTQVDYFSLLKLTSWGRARHERMEQEVFRWADKTTIVSNTWRDDLIAIGAQNVEVIPWGFDPEDYQNLEPELDDHFTITHLGIMGYDRNPVQLFRALRQLIEEFPDLRQDLRLQLIGQVDYSVREAVALAGIEEQTVYPGSVSRQEALQRTRSSQVLLLLLNQQANAQGRMPGKFFEYLAVRRPILNIGPVSSDVAQIVSATGSGYNCDYDDYEGMLSALRQLYEDYRAGKLRQDLSTDVSAYSIRNLTEKIAGYLDEIAVKS